MGSFRRTLAPLAAALLAFPAAALAQDTNAPPGNSAIEEYLEAVPGAGGNKVPRGSAEGRSALTAAQRERLERLGPDGRSLVGVVEATAPQRAKADTPPPPDGEGRSPLSRAIAAAGGSDGGSGLGIVLPAILLATLLGTLALVLARRRSASS